jgi:hypothetical protein
VNTKKHVVRFSIHQINAPKFLLLSFKVLLQKRHGAMQELFKKIEKENKKREKKKKS